MFYIVYLNVISHMYMLQCVTVSVSRVDTFTNNILYYCLQNYIPNLTSFFYSIVSIYKLYVKQYIVLFNNYN